MEEIHEYKMHLPAFLATTSMSMCGQVFSIALVGTTLVLWARKRGEEEETPRQIITVPTTHAGHASVSNEAAFLGTVALQHDGYEGPEIRHYHVFETLGWEVSDESTVRLLW